MLSKEFPTTGENSAQRVSGQTVIINVLVNDCDTIDYRNTYGLGSEVIDMVKVIVDVTTPDKPTTTTVEFKILGDSGTMVWILLLCLVSVVFRKMPLNRSNTFKGI